MPKTGEHVKFKTDEWKTKSLFIIYADFESIFVPEDIEKQNPDEPCSDKLSKIYFLQLWL